MSWQTVALGLILPWEMYRSHPYQDEGGVWTYGYGSTRQPNGRPVTATTPPISEPDAQAAVENFLLILHGAFLAHSQRAATDNQAGSMMSLAYNIGQTRFLASSVLRDFNAGNLAVAANDFLKWDEDDGEPSDGLLRRRTAERAIFQKA